jgi:hypothetical protein
MPDEKKEESTEPQPIEFTATYHPDGKLEIHCPLMHNALLMKGFMVMLTEGVNAILAGQGIKDTPKIHPAKGGILGFARKRFQ